MALLLVAVAATIALQAPGIAHASGTEADVANSSASGIEEVDAVLFEAYSNALQQVVRMNWMRPASAEPGLRCVIQIQQDEAGRVLELRIAEPCNADATTRESIEAAVRRAEPLPHAGFETVLTRSVQFVFRYD